MEPKLKIQEIQFHRNGVSGSGFHAVRFDVVSGPDGERGSFLATVFEGPGDIAVINLDRIAEYGVGLGNKWRGDYYESTIRAAIKQDLDDWLVSQP
jgi:hypothetical protein